MGGVFTKHDTIPRENGLVSQRWKCKTCKKVFVYRGGMERMRCESGAVSDMLDQSSKGVSHVNIADSLSRKGLVRNPASVGKTLKKYTTAIQNYTLRIPINHVGDRTRGDELYLKIKGVEHFLFGATDEKTRFFLAQDLSDRKEGTDATRLVLQSVNRAGKYPTEFITDCLGSYKTAYRTVLAPKNPLDDHCVHIADPDAATKNKSNRKSGDCTADKSDSKCTHIDGSVRVLYTRHHDAIRILLQVQ